MADAVRAVARAAYGRGARWVDVLWFDMLVKRARLELAPEDSLEFVPPWIGERMRWLSDEHAARVSLTGSDSTIFDGIDPVRMGRDLLPYVKEVPEVVNARTTNWTAGPCPNPRWAERVHPELDPEAALDKLWDEIVHVCRLDADDPVEAWRERMRAIVASAERLSERRFDAIHLRGPGTDLTVGLLPSHRWLGADFTTVDGLTHYPNLPTEEIFTTPDPERVDGHVSATMPLEVYGSFISGIEMTFEGGRATKVDARRGRGGAALDRREGGRRPARRARARRRRRTDRPARHGLLRDAARRERGEPHRARQRLHLPARGRGRPRSREPQRPPRRLHDREPRGRRRRDHARRRDRSRPPGRRVADLSDAQRFAELIVEVGANVQEGQEVEILADLGTEEVVRAIAGAAYRKGARFVDVWWWDALAEARAPAPRAAPRPSTTSRPSPARACCGSARSAAAGSGSSATPSRMPWRASIPSARAATCCRA